MSYMATALEQLVIGIDIGGTGTKFGIVDRDGNVLFSSEISTKKHATVESFIEELYSSLSELIERSGGSGRIKGIGVGAPNGNFYTGTIEYAPNLPGKALFLWPNYWKQNLNCPLPLPTTPMRRLLAK